MKKLKSLLLALALLAPASGLLAQATPAWIPWSTGWTRWDGGIIGTTTNLTSCDTTPISSLLTCTISSPTISITAPVMTAKTFWAGPQSGSPALPTARTLTGSDIAGVTGSTYLSSTSTTTVTNTASETSLFSGTILGASNTSTTRYRMEIYGTWHAATTIATITLKIYYGASAVYTSPAYTPSTNANDGAMYIESNLIFKGATNSEIVYSRAVLSNRATPASDIFNGWTANGDATVTAAVDGTADQTYKVTVTFGTAQPTMTLTKLYARVTRYPD